MEYLHTMIRVTDLKATIAFFELMGFVETRRIENEKGRFTLVFLAAPDDVGAGEGEPEADRRAHLQLGPGGLHRRAQFRPSRLCRRRHLCDSAPSSRRPGVTINRPPRDGHMAFIRTPDNISIELIQKGESKAAGRAVGVVANIGVW